MRFGREIFHSLTRRSLVMLSALTVLFVSMSALVVVNRVEAAHTLNTFVEGSEESVPQLTSHVDRPSSLWIGDSFTQGGAAYPRIVCAELGWYCNIDAQGSTGFVNEGAPELRASTSRFIDRLPISVKEYKADIIIVDGGRNDMTMNPAEVVAAIRTYVDALHAAWPAAKLVIIVPFLLETVPTYPYSTFGIDNMASTLGATVLDPYAEGWFAGADIPAMMIEDLVHPNALGNSYIAAKLEESLERAHVVTPGSPNGGLG